MKIGDQIGPYRILELLGTGGMGAVFRAFHSELKREVALKVLKPIGEETAHRRFVREMQLLSRLSHPNLVKVYDGGRIGETDYIAMELLSGTTLDRAFLPGSGMPYPEALPIIQGIVEGLTYLHGQNILHRDLKLANIILTEAGEAKILDFGLAMTPGSTMLTAPGRVVGTPSFMAPELLAGEPANAQSDLWSLGCILYYLVTGVHPAGPDVMRNPRLLLNPDIKPVASLVADLPPRIASMVMRLLTKDPLARTARASDVLDELAMIQQEMLARRPDPPRRPSRSSKPLDPDATASLLANSVQTGVAPKRTAGILAVTAALMVAGLAGLWMGQPVSSPSPPSPPPSSGSPVPSPRNSPRLISTWRSFSDETVALGTPARAKAALVRVRRRSTVDLGTSPKSWLWWIKLGHWLEDPSQTPPRSGYGETGVMGYADQRNISRQTRDAGRGISPLLVAMVVRATGDFPDDGGAWLVLGRALEWDGDPRGALAAYSVGLSRMKGVLTDSWDSLQFEALARALDQVPGRSIEREWMALAGLGLSDRVANAIFQGFLNHRPRCQRLLELGFTVPRHREMTYYFLGRLYELHPRDPERSRKAWHDGVAEIPASAQIRTALAEHYLARGDLDAARPVGAALPATSRVQVALKYLDRAPAVGPDTSYMTESFNYEMARFHQIETGDLKGALGRGKLTAPVALELLGAGESGPTVVELCRKELFANPPNASLWEVAAGALSSKQGQPYMVGFLRDARPSAFRTGELDLIKSLFESRSGDHRRALESLARIGSAGGAAAEGSLRPAEVLIRAYLEGVPVGNNELGANTNPEFEKCWKALVARDFSRAAQLAADRFDREPNELVWILLELAAARGRGDATATASWARRGINLCRHRGSQLWVLRELAARR